LIKKWHDSAGGRIRGSVVVTTLRAGTTELFQKSKKLADDAGVVLQIHMNPGTGGGFVEEMMKTHGACHVAYLDKIGALGHNVLLVHMSYPTTDEEVEMMRLRDAKACHCPGAALHGGYGVVHGKIPELVNAGVGVSLGTDGAPSCNFNDMVRIMYLAAGIHKDFRANPTIMSPETVLEMATLHGARALQWETDIGSIEVGKKADIAIFNAQRPEWLPLLNPVSNLVYSASGDGCETVIIDGKVVMEGKKLLTMDEKDLLARATPMAQTIMERAGLDATPKWPMV
jgi:5-methylthioadenosine/S-adenosylhomocysteine deaminase